MANDEIFIYSLQGERPTPTRLVVKPMTYHDYRFVFDGQGLRVGFLDDESFFNHKDIWKALSTTRGFNPEIDDAGCLNLTWACTPEELSAEVARVKDGLAGASRERYASNKHLQSLTDVFGITVVTVDRRSYSFSLHNRPPNLQIRETFVGFLRELFPPPTIVRYEKPFRL